MGRLPLAAVAASSALLVMALASAEELRLNVDEARAHRYLRSFGGSFARLGRTGRWTGPASSIVLHGAGAGEWVITLGISGGMPGRPQTISLVPAAGGRRVHVEPPSASVATGWQEYAFRVAVPRWPPSVAPVELALATAPYRQGAEGTELGVRVTSLAVQPQGGAGARVLSAIPVAVSWTWALALLAGVIVHSRRWLAGAARFDRAPAGRLDRAAAVFVAVTGFALATYAWRDPWGFAWTLPPLTAALVVSTAALLMVFAEERSEGSASPASARNFPVSAVLGLAALAVLYAQRGGRWAALAVLAGSFVWMAARLRTGVAAEALPAPLTPRRVWLGLAAVAIVAAAMRFAYIRDLPYGLWRDDARFGLAALQMIEDPSYRPGFVLVVNLPQQGMQMLGLGLQAFGITSWSMRTVPALAGALSVLALFGLAGRLSGRVDVALVSAAFLAVASWHVTVSRMTSPAALHPLFELLGLWCLAEAWRVGPAVELSQPLRTALLLAGGAFVGIALQTYQSGRASPLVAAAFLAAYWSARRVAAARWRDVFCVALGFAIAGAPLLGYAWREWGDFNARAGVVFVPSAAAADATAPLAALDASLGRHLLMFNVQGDSQGRRNVPLRPMLDPVTGIGFLVGLLALFRRRRDPRALFLLAALALGLVPSALAIEGPHALRAVGGVAWACVIAAIGWIELAARTPAAHRASLLTAAAVAALALNAWTYFKVAAHDERVWGSFYTVETKVGSFVRDRAAREGRDATARIHLSQQMADNWVIRFLAYGLPVRTFEAARVGPLPAEALFVVAHEADRERVFRIAAERSLAPPELAGIGPLLPDRRTPSFTLYRLR
jgi:4-amino-4-deoxy-L-arabinose transferase-like glycosyltransferase